MKSCGRGSTGEPGTPAQLAQAFPAEKALGRPRVFCSST